MNTPNNHSTLGTTSVFEAQIDAAPRDVQVAVAEAFELFENDPYHDSLNNHPLRDRYAGFRSINITPDWRALFKTTTEEQGSIYLFYFLGTHKQLYGV